MTQMPLFSPTLWSVSQLTLYLRDLLESDEMLQDLWVSGEVSNFSRPSSGHLYFTIKDGSSAIKCVMWRNAAARLDALPRDGQAIEVHGGLGIYEAAGQYQLYVDSIRPAGEGVLYQEFLRLKAKLEAEGLFDPERKRPIPRWPHRIGIVTSPTGAALRDMLNTLRRRYPIVDVILAPSPVQGDEAPLDLVTALQALNQLAQPDVILLARGGGSIEDLWAFNDERLARAITASPAPVISGVGHETDFTIADFVADLRAPTPTAAAELATPNRRDLLSSLNETHQRLERIFYTRHEGRRWNLDRLQNRLALRSPFLRLRSERQHLDEIQHRYVAALAHRRQLQSLRLAGLSAKLAALDPLRVLQRGYAVVTADDGQLVRSIQNVASGEVIGVRLYDGQFKAHVEDLSPDSL